ncbi:hypothetical protein Y695_02024 [Hydrogenophaga sp. T4]|nr:hypothetical protein Y695_02024 [Hydrogenophaga sp. T4]
MKPIQSRGRPICSATARLTTNRAKPPVYQRYTLSSCCLNALLAAMSLALRRDSGRPVMVYGPSSSTPCWMSSRFMYQA